MKSNRALAGLFQGFYRDKRVFVTGHTGFKGSWLCEWLTVLGARVSGFALEPSTDPALFEQIGLAQRLDHQIGDVLDAEQLAEAVAAAQPDVVFHLAAQPIVRLSFAEPVLTYGTNVMGTVHLLQALRRLDQPCAAVFITSDKVYENREWHYGYREDDQLGGFDPYSSSKACAELAIASFRRSFFSNGADGRLAIASARAGNVIGGGDWAPDRIVPDCVRALLRAQPIGVRNPSARRSWQHVLEPLSGYLHLGQRIHPDGGAIAAQLCTAFNFGPAIDSNRSVGELVAEILGHWPGRWEDQSDPGAPHEAGLLHLNIDKARHCLGWEPVWPFTETIARTVGWYRDVVRDRLDVAGAAGFTRAQIMDYCQQARERQLVWAES